MYAGPEPEIAVTASWYFSGTRTTWPTLRSKVSTVTKCSSVLFEPELIAAIPWSTKAGVFGITRITGVLAGSKSSMKPVVIPAASETTKVPGLSESLISSKTIAIS